MRSGEPLDQSAVERRRAKRPHAELAPRPCAGKSTSVGTSGSGLELGAGKTAGVAAAPVGEFTLQPASSWVGPKAALRNAKRVCGAMGAGGTVSDMVQAIGGQIKFSPPDGACFYWSAMMGALGVAPSTFATVRTPLTSSVPAAEELRVGMRRVRLRLAQWLQDPTHEAFVAGERGIGPTLDMFMATEMQRRLTRRQLRTLHERMGLTLCNDTVSPSNARALIERAEEFRDPRHDLHISRVRAAYDRIGPRIGDWGDGSDPYRGARRHNEVF